MSRPGASAGERARSGRTSALARAARYATLVPGLFLLGCLELAPDLDLQNCDEREARARDPDLATCAYASDLMDAADPDSCVPASAFDGDADCLVLDADAVLCSEARPFDMEVYLVDSGLSLDCNGQTIEHADDRRERSGIRAPYEHSVSDIHITGCSIQHVMRYGVDLKRLFRGGELDGPMRGHERIVLEDVQIAGTGQIGIYVGQNSRDVTIDAAVITDTYAGIYLEAGSKRTLVTRAVISDSYERAGIHIDSSQDNVIEHSVFRGNAGGAISLYKNCGERYGQVCPIRRQLDASGNTIRHNELHGDGVAVAARQFKTYGAGWCAGIDLLGHWRDHSRDNAIYGNRFYDGSTLDIQDAPNEVSSNYFHGSVLEIGAGNPVGDNPIYFSGRIAGNTFDEHSWISAQGSASRAFHAVEVVGNTDEGGACHNEYRPVVSCAMRAWGACYGRPRKIRGSSCRLK